VAYRFAVPRDWYEKYKTRRYGFHGISHLYVAKKVAEYLKQDLSSLNLITAHLGNGCSVACIRNGKSVDTSMGFTPLEGLVMGTRSGDIGASAVEYYCKQSGKDISEVIKILNTQSGLKALCGSNDMRDIVKKKEEGDKEAELAFDIFCYSVRKYIGEYFFTLDCDVDAIVFTGGIGENSLDVRTAVMSGLSKIGVIVDEKENKSKEKREIWQISEETGSLSAVKRVFVVKTNEELEVSEQIFECLGKKQGHMAAQ